MHLFLPILGLSLFLLTLFLVKSPDTLAFMDSEEKNKIHIYLVGDSTVSNYKKNVAPRMGWGQVLQESFSDEVIVRNKAVSKRSSKSYYEEGRLAKVLKQLKKGDYLFIQFGHNDQKQNDPKRFTEPNTTYKLYLKKYINGARSVGAIPVLITPVERRKFTSNGRIQDTHRAYREAMFQLAKDEQVQLIDLTYKSKQLFNELGPEKTKELFLWLRPNESEHFPEGKKDNTHFQEKGAYLIASLVIEGIKELQLPLQKYIEKGK